MISSGVWGRIIFQGEFAPLTPVGYDPAYGVTCFVRHSKQISLYEKLVVVANTER